MTLRTQQTQDLYRKATQDGLPDITINKEGKIVFDLEKIEILEEYQHWVRVVNRYPYDMVAQRNDMLVAKRVFSSLSEAMDEELHEYIRIKDSLPLSEIYDSVVENLRSDRTIHAHFHAHLIKWKNM